jgi:hypothetical protein
MLVGVLFLFIFFIKMALTLASVFSVIDKKTSNSVIMQLEHETENGKEHPSKDTFKDKKASDENFVSVFEYRHIVIETNVLHNLEKSLYKQVYHPVIPTPPPNA